jgi:hypothetical protein
MSQRHRSLEYWLSLERRAELKAKKRLPDVHLGLTFSEAADRWFKSRSPSVGRARYVAPRTLRDLQQYIRALNRKFGDVQLREIHIDLLREYQMERAETCGPSL